MSNAAHVVVLVLLLAGCAGQNRPLQLASASGPEYPASARAAGIEGFVVVRYDVTVDGRVVNAMPVRAEPDGVFEEAAVASVSGWVFVAPIVDGEAVEVIGRESRVTFKLADGTYDDY